MNTKKRKKELLVVPVNNNEMSPQNLIAQAITQNVPVETMEKLMNLQDRWEAKQAKKAFDEAMADFQMECPIIKKNTSVKDSSGKILYHYARIESIISQVKPFIQKNGFSYRIVTGERNSKLFADCIVKHKLGHTETTPFEVPLGKGTNIMSEPQKEAASLTFAKRYAFLNAFGIMTGDEDTDAKKEESKNKKTDYLYHLKAKLQKLGAKSESAALQILLSKTGIELKSFEGVSQQEAGEAYAALIENEKANKNS